MIDIILLILTSLSILLLGMTVFLLLKQKQSPKDALQKSDLQMVTDFLNKTLDNNQKASNEQLATLQRLISQQQDSLQLSHSQLRGELTKILENLTLSNEKKFDSIRTSMMEALTNMQKDNADKLEKMRETVDEKLNKTLEERLTQKFQLISSQFETVQKGFGEMQSLVTGVDELKRALSNVKTRGIMGEMQLSRILEEILSPDMYLKEVPTKPGSHDRVEFAIKLPGDDARPIFLPIDSKFPLEDYYRVLEAYDTADKIQVDAALKVLESKIEKFAADIAGKYIEVPYTTNFAILFLPIEGLYAEVIRRGLVDKLQTKYSIVLAGPTTMAALLNSLQIGFKTLKIQKKSQEVWTVLASAKTEFDKFAEVLAKTQEKITQAGSELDKLIGTRTRMIQSKLRNLESIGDNLKIETPLISEEE
jgi:DNA recombination protein RmuC